MPRPPQARLDLYCESSHRRSSCSRCRRVCFIRNRRRYPGGSWPSLRMKSEALLHSQLDFFFFLKQLDKQPCAASTEANLTVVGLGTLGRQLAQQNPISAGYGFICRHPIRKKTGFFRFTVKSLKPQGLQSGADCVPSKRTNFCSTPAHLPTF